MCVCVYLVVRSWIEVDVGMDVVQGTGKGGVKGGMENTGGGGE